LEVQGFVDPSADIVPNHQRSELFAIDENDSKGMTFGEILRGLREVRGRHKDTLVRFCRAKAAAECPDLWFTDPIIDGVPHGLNIAPIEAQRVLVNDAVDTTVAGSSDHLSCVYP